MLNTDELLESSLQRDSATPDGGSENRDAFLDRERDKLRCLKIEPRPVTAIAGDWARTYGDFNQACYQMIAVAGQKQRWLLVDPETELFSLAEGELDGKLSLVGFASDDALGEWRG